MINNGWWCAVSSSAELAHLSGSMSVNSYSLQFLAIECKALLDMHKPFICIWVHTATFQCLDTWHLPQSFDAFDDTCTGDTKKRELLKNPTKIEEIQEKKFIDINWTITTCLLRDSNPHNQCLKITSCRWRHPPRMHSFTATTHLKSSRSFVSPCVCCMLCRMRRRTGTFEMRSGSERMHMWRRTPSTGRNFQTLIIWITVS